jgi:hypothetical protein
VGGGSVGTGVPDGGIEVFVGGGRGVRVAGGIGVLVGFGEGVGVADGLGTLVRTTEVALTAGGTFGVSVRVMTRVGRRVAVGLREAMASVGVEEASKSAPSVSAMAVRV